MFSQVDGSILLSIRPEYATKIYSGEKKYELRKSFPRRPVSHVFLFETKGSSRISGYFTVGCVHRGNWRMAAERARDQIDPVRAAEYFAGHERGTVIGIERAVKLAEPISLPQLKSVCPTFTVPQNFLILDKSSPLREFIISRSFDFDCASEDFRLSPLPTSEFKKFENLANAYIGKYYEDITADFGKKITVSTTEGFDRNGYFTKSKTAFVIYYSGRKIGYTTLTLKRGNSVKSGPTILFEEFQGKGIGVLFRHYLDNLLVSNGIRKVYCTCPDCQHSVFSYLLKSGYKIEAHLQCQYAKDHGEFVFGRMLQQPSFRKFVVARHNAKITNIKLGGLTSMIFEKHFLQGFSKYYFPIDETFGENLVSSIRPISDTMTFFEKRKLALLGYGGRHPNSLVILSPKRGGAGKLTFVFNTSNADAIDRMLERAEIEAGKAAMRKIYTAYSNGDRLVAEALKQRGFEVEGVLREPYQAGIDFVVSSKFIVR